MEITSLSQLDLTKSYTYADYFSWKIQDRVELFKGKIFINTPSPNRKHQEISQNIVTELSVYLKNHSCKVYFAPFDV
jgi:Putative restriction endonuclease